MMQNETDSVDIVASVLDDFAAGKITWDEVDMRLHDKRYHRDHYDPETMTCKFRESRFEAGYYSPNEVPSERNQYYKKLAHKYSPVSVTQRLWDEFGVECFYATDVSKLRSELWFDNLNEAIFHLKGAPVSEEIYNRNVGWFYAVLSDMASRFPKMKLDNPIFIPWETREKIGWYSSATLDRQNPRIESCITMGDMQTKDGKTLPIGHIIRHEIGHHLTTVKIGELWKSYVKSFSSASEYIEAIEKWLTPRARVNMDEAIAEAFAIYTSPDFYNEMLPEEIKKIMKIMTNEDHSLESVAQDDTNGERKDIRLLHPAYYMVGDTFDPDEGVGLNWMDNCVGLVGFKTFDEKLKYALSKYEVSKEWVDRFIAEFPGREWSGMDIDMIRTDYRNSNKSLEEVIHFYKGWFNE